MKLILPLPALTLGVGLVALTTLPTEANVHPSDTGELNSPAVLRPIPIARTEPAATPRPKSADSESEPPNQPTGADDRRTPEPTLLPSSGSGPVVSQSVPSRHAAAPAPDSPVMLTGNAELDQILLEIHAILRPIVGSQETSTPKIPAIVIPPRDRN